VLIFDVLKKYVFINLRGCLYSLSNQHIKIIIVGMFFFAGIMQYYPKREASCAFIISCLFFLAYCRHTRDGTVYLCRIK
jgi:hypothetical protein